MLDGCQFLPGAEFYVAIDDKGLWPNLTLLPTGEILAAVYNHPSHGLGTGSNVEAWVSTDEGRSWTFRSTMSDLGAEPTGIRMNHAVGLTQEGVLVGLVSGYHCGQRLPHLPLQCCISGDGGVSWRRHIVDVAGVPFGDVIALPGGRLACPMYRRLSSEPRVNESFLIFSSDGGGTWGDTAVIGDTNETHVLPLRGESTWLAAGRTSCSDRMDNALPHGNGEVLFRSEDGGMTWVGRKPISPQGQENAHLLELRDGRVLCCFTSRIPGLFGVVLRVSSDGGVTWSVPCVLVSIPARDWTLTDIGYPSSVQLDDGTIVTAYYAGPKRPDVLAAGAPWHQRYHMGVARWTPELLPDF